MDFSKFFIDRPIFAAVIAIVVVVAGAVAVPFLQIPPFPEITPPQGQVTATYPRASAEGVQTTVTPPIEEQVNGMIDGLVETLNEQLKENILAPMMEAIQNALEGLAQSIFGANDSQGEQRDLMQPIFDTIEGLLDPVSVVLDAIKAGTAKKAK